MSKQINVTFIGLGTMGYHMAGHLSKHPDVAVTVWNRSNEKGEKWQTQFNGTVAPTLFDAVQQADVVMSCAGKDEDMEEIILAKTGVYDALKAGCIFVDHTTTSFKLANKLETALAKKEVHFIDAPVSGGEAGAVNGCLTVMAGGEAEVLAKVEPLLKCYAKNITHIGTCGYGQLAKMTNQICIAGVLQGLSEALLFAEAEEIDVEKLLSAISGGAAQSWQMENRANTMHQRDFDFGFAIKWMVKDLGYCLDRAAENKTDLSYTQQVYNKYVELISDGQGYMDTSALILANQEKETNVH